MRYLLFLFVFLKSSFFILAQQTDLSGLQGLKDKNGDVFLELSGYEISITSEKGEISNRRTVNAMKNKYRLWDVLTEYSDDKIRISNYVIESETFYNNQKCVLLQEDKNKITVLYLTTINGRNLFLEQQLIDTYLQNKFIPYISDDWIAKSINIAGKPTLLGDGYEWLAPHIVSGKDGTIGWSEFQSMSDAEQDINNRIDISFSDEMHVMTQGDIQVMFEGIPTLAYRIVYKYHAVKSEYLIVYYIAEKVRDRYVSCTLNYHSDNVNDFELPSLLQKLMMIKNVPIETLISPEEEEEYLYSEETVKDRSKMNVFEIQAGTWLPIGKMNSVFPVAPSVAIYAGYPFNNKMKLDIGMSIAVPVNPSYFEYHDNKVSYPAKPRVIFGLNMRYHYQWEIQDNIFLSMYGGLGINGLATDLKKEYYDEDESEYESCESLDVLGGITIRRKLIGAFIEYHFLPYQMSGKVKSKFGNSVINMGILFSF